MKYKILLAILTIIFFAALISSDLGSYKQNACVNVYTVLNTSSVNISISGPSNNTAAGQAFVIGAPMTAGAGGYFNYSFCNTSILGTYPYGYIDSQGNPYSNSFTITATGGTFNNAQSTLYFLILVVALIFFAIFLMLGLFLPYKNKTDEYTGYILAVNNLKYVKILCFCFAALTLVLITYFSYTITYSFLNMAFLSQLFYFAFIGSIVLTFVMFIVGVYVMIANWIRDSQVTDQLLQGLRIKAE